MSCVNPITVRNKKDPLRPFVRVPCGKCKECLNRRRYDWCIRLTDELKSSTSAFFITFTYSDENLIYVNGNPSLKKSELQKLFKRMRNDGQDFKYFGAGEYGDEFSRPHYHVIFFNLERSYLSKLQSTWNKGLIHIGTVTEKSIQYTTKYVLKENKVNEGVEPEFALMSKKLGLKYLDKNKNALKSSILAPNFNKTIPRYYKDKLMLSIDEKAVLREKIIREMDSSDDKHINNCEKIGMNPFLYKQQIRENSILCHNKNKRKSKL